MTWSVEVTPGMLMVLNHEGKLEPSSIAYDKKVVGVGAGAGNRWPGIVLDHKNETATRVMISVLGKVSCKADATYGPIEVGDLLTTHYLPGVRDEGQRSAEGFWFDHRQGSEPP